MPHLDITEDSIMYNAGGLHAGMVDTFYFWTFALISPSVLFQPPLTQ